MNRRQFLKLTMAGGVAAGGLMLLGRKDEPVPVADAAKPLYTFDDVPYDRQLMAELLGVMGTCSCQAQFYFTGRGMLEHRESVELVLEAGYPVGWHSMHHDVISRMSDAELVRDIADWKTVVEEVWPGYEPYLARFPYGNGTQDQIRILAEEGLHIQPCAWGGVQPANWDIDTFDWHPWKIQTPASIISEIGQGCLAADKAVVILLHLNLAKPAEFSLARRDLVEGQGDMQVMRSMLTDDPDKFRQIIV